MLKLKKFLKPYIGICIVSLAFLFLQVMMELNLPNYLSKIVDDGLQKGGIVSSIPEAVSADGMAFLQGFMTDEDKKTVGESFYKENELSVNLPEKLAKKFPLTTEKDAYILNADLDDATKENLEGIFGRSMYTFIDLSKQMASDGATTHGDAVDKTAGASFEVEKLYAITPMLAQLPKEVLQKSIDTATDQTQDTLLQTSATFIKGFYTELGCDIGKIQMNTIYKNGAIMLGISLLDVFAAIMVGFFSSRVGAAVARDLRHSVFKKVTDFSNNEFDKFSTASLITRTTNDVTQVQMVVQMALRMLCFAPAMGIGAIIMALSKCVSMSWIIALAVVVLIGTIALVSSIAMPRFKKMQQLVDKLNLVVRENLSGMLVIRAFDNQKFEEKRFDKANKDLTQNSLFVNRLMTFLMPFMMLVMNATMLLIIWNGSHQIAASNLQVGAMMAFMQYAMEVIMSFVMISMMFIMLPRAAVSGDRIYEVLSTESSINNPEKPEVFDCVPTQGKVEFKNVCFKYSGADENVLEDISFTANPGETTAFIGSTGSGKSTLIN
ncbi:MAG: ABC transporter ATP-binding protein, partial [Oscillospiraceae bacterium]